MITQIRRKLKSKTARNLVLWIILLTLSAGFITTIIFRVFRLETKMGGSFASVNGNEISQSHFRMKQQENEQRIQMLKKYFGPDAEKLIKQMQMATDTRIAALQTVVNQELMNQLAERLNIQLSSDLIARKFADQNFLQNEFGLIDFGQVMDPVNGFDSQRLLYFLKFLGLSGQEFEEMAFNALKREVLTEIASNSYYVPEFEIRQKYIEDYLSKKFSILKFDFNSFMQEAEKEKVSKQDLQRFYDSENSKSKRYWAPEKRSGAAYYFDVNSYGIDLTESDIKIYYDDNKINMYVKEPAKVQVRRILFKDGADSEQKAKETRQKLILDPASFANIAKEISQDKDSAKNGGLMPLFSRGKMDAEFEKAAFLLKEDGNISEVVKTKSGHEILQRVKREEIKYKPMAEVAGQIKDKLIVDKFKRMFSSDMNKILSKNYFDENKFNDLIKKSIKNEKIEPKIAGEDNISSALFRIRENVPAYYVEGDKGVVVTLTVIENGHFPELSSVEQAVAGDYYEKKASNKLNIVIKQVAQEAKTKPLSEIEKAYMDKYKFESVSTGLIKEGDAEKTKALRAKGWPIDKVFGLEIPGSANYYRTDASETANGFVAKLDEIEKFDDSDYQKKKIELKKEIVKAKNMAQLEEFIAFLRKKATIKISK